MFHPNDNPLDRGWVGRIEDDRMLHLAAQTLQSFFLVGGGSRVHAEYPLADVTLVVPVQYPPTVRLFDDTGSFRFANATAVVGPNVPVAGTSLTARGRIAVVIGAGGEIGGTTALLEWHDPAEQLDVKRSDFGLVLGPVVVTPDETATASFACRLSAGARTVEGAPAAFSWAEALALAGHRTMLRPGDVIAGPPVVVLDGRRRRRGARRGRDRHARMSPGSQLTRLVLDWDGTITERDTLHMAIEEFGDVELFHALEEQIGRELTLNEVIGVEMGTISAPFDAVLDWLLETVVVRPGLPELVAAHDPLIISAGFHELIEPVLAREGVAATVVANSIEADPAGWRSTFLEREACAVCGEPCKRVALAGTAPYVYVGDGISDRCASLAAERVFARSGLAQYLTAQGVAFEPFEDLHDVREALEA